MTLKSRCIAIMTRAAAAAMMAGALLQPASAETISIYGSSTFYSQLMQPLQGAIEAKSGHKLMVVSNKSSLGVMALFEKRADLAMISASLESQIAALKRTHPAMEYEKLKNFPVMHIRASFAINPKNPVRNVSVAQIRKILTGEITNWKALGGTDTPIRVVIVRGGGGVPTAVEGELLEGKPISATEHAIYVQSGQHVMAVVGQEPGALGLAQLGLVQKHKLPELKTDRPVDQQLNLVSLGEPTAAMRAVIKATQDIAAARAEKF
jgi:phosphate transport system substrate-binding protein